jgi:hypothetical protein
VAERKSLYYRLKRPEDLAAEEFLKSIPQESIKEYLEWFEETELAKNPKRWNLKLKMGVGKFAAVPKKDRIAEIREILGIKDGQIVATGPVYSGEWSELDRNAIGIDFSEEALKRHPNKNRVQADLRNLPLPDNYVDHFVIFEPTPLHAGTASPGDVLRTLLEAGRVSRKYVHVLQRAIGKYPIWSAPFLLKYLENLGIKYETKDITDQVNLDRRAADWYRAVAVSITSEDIKKQAETIKKDIDAFERFMRRAKRGSVVTAWRKLEQEASPALRKALFHQYFAEKVMERTSRAK